MRSTITTKGRELLAKLNLGEISMSVTEVRTGSGVYTPTENIADRTALKDEQDTYTFSSSTAGTGLLTLKAIITNVESGTAIVTEDYRVNEYGIFVTVNNVKYLYMIAVADNDTGNLMPAYTGDNPVNFVETFKLTISGDANVTVNMSGAAALATDLENLADDVSELDTDIQKHAEALAYSETGVHGFHLNVSGDFVVEDGEGNEHPVGGSGASFRVSINDRDPSHVGETITLTDGTNTYTATISVLGAADIDVTVPGYYTAYVNGTAMGSVSIGEYMMNIGATIYGFHLNMQKSDPTQIITYDVEYDGVQVQNYNYTPVSMNFTTGVLDPGSWNMTDDFFIPKSCMLKYDGTVDYYLDENDETKKADGTASDVANTSYGGNAMMEWGRDGKRIYMKIVPDSTVTNGMTVYFSDNKLDNDFTDYPFYDCDGNEIDHFYTPKYNGSLISGKLRSISGQSIMNNQSGSNEISYATANNTRNGKTEWYIEQWGDRMMINMLLLMIGKSTNTQAVFGHGYTDGGSGAGSLKASGTANGKGMFYGTSTNDTAKVFGMEHWWGNIWRRIAGLLNMSGTIKYKMTWSTVDGSTGTGYNADGSGYKTVANCTPGGTSGGYVNGVVCNEDGMFSKTASGSETTYLCDGLWFNNSQANYAIVGGACSAGAPCGALCVALGNALSSAGWAVGAALSCKPLAAAA